MDVSRIKEQAAKAKPLTEKLFAKLKKDRPQDLDDTFHDLHQEVFEKTDCLTCANCCKTTSPIFRQMDIERLSRHLKMSPSQFIQKYLHIDEDKDYVLNTAPCAFLDEENYCSVYKERPAACREYPHTDRKRMYQLLDLALKNTFVCPAVLHITEKLRSLY
jgi:Fe-S-cluster containining protein